MDEVGVDAGWLLLASPRPSRASASLPIGCIVVALRADCRRSGECRNRTTDAAAAGRDPPGTRSADRSHLRRDCRRCTTSPPCRPRRICLPPISPSATAVRRMCTIGDCQRMISDTALGISEGLSRSLRYSSGWLFSAHTPPDIELRVVSLPPTMSSTRFPRKSLGFSGRFRVASPCASIDSRSGCGSCFWRS